MSREALRKGLHLAAGGMAFALRILGPAGSFLFALGAVFFNVFLLPRIGGRKLWRKSELDRGIPWGILFYPITVSLLILLFWRRLEVAAAIWALLAFGDGMAAIVGQALGRPRLPWNFQKSWVGTGAYWIFGSLGVWGLLLWTAPGRYPPSFALGVAIATALLAALLESWPLGLDDNLGVPLVSALFLFALLLTEGHWMSALGGDFTHRLLIGAAVNLGLAGIGFAIRGMDLSGMIAGFALGTLVWAFAGWPAYSLLLAFFGLGTGLTRLGYERKASEKLAQEGGGRRSARNALANLGVAALASVLIATTDHPHLFALGVAGAFATAAADTTGSEIGQLWGRRTWLVTSLRPVPRGTEGAISVAGTAASLAAALLLAALAQWVELVPRGTLWLVAGAGFAGALADSVLGATLESRGLLDNEAVNFSATLIGALIALGLGLWLT